MQRATMSSNARGPGGPVLRALGVFSDLALWLSYGATAKLAWNWWMGATSPLWLVFGTLGTMLGVVLLKTVAMYWDTQRAFALLTVAMAGLESVAVYHLIAAPLADPWAVDMFRHLTWALLGWATLWIWWSCATNALRARRLHREQLDQEAT